MYHFIVYSMSYRAELIQVLLVFSVPTEIRHSRLISTVLVHTPVTIPRWCKFHPFNSHGPWSIASHGATVFIGLNNWKGFRSSDYVGWAFRECGDWYTSNIRPLKKPHGMMDQSIHIACYNPTYMTTTSLSFRALCSHFHLPSEDGCYL